MAPVVSQINHVAVQPYEHGQINASEAIKRGTVPLEHWMLHQTKNNELNLFTTAANEHPAEGRLLR